MENNLENKAKFFAQYYTKEPIVYRQGYHNRANKDCNKVDEFDLLQLKTLSSITDEDAIEVGKILKIDDLTEFSDWKGYLIEILIDELAITANSIFNYIKTIDYLRSKGYALHYMGLSIEQQIEYGWIRLIE